jgi:GT2 family glycosyltransferase
VYGAHRARSRDWICLDSSGRYSGSWVELVYAASFFCLPARPLLRFVLGDGQEEFVTLPAPVCGRAIWRGKVPVRATLWIDPGPDVPHDRFQVEQIIELSFASIAARAARSPRAGLIGLVQHASGRRDGARRKLAGPLHDEPLEAYEAWRDSRRRDPEPAGLDRVPEGLNEVGPLLLTGSDGSIELWLNTLASLSMQFCPDWRLRLTAPAELADALKALPVIRHEPRIEVLEHGQTSHLNCEALGALELEPGDCLPVEAIGVLRWLFDTYRDVDGFSFDADEPGRTGERKPVLRLPRPDRETTGRLAVRLSAPETGPEGERLRNTRHMPRILLHGAHAEPETAPARSVLSGLHPPVDIVIPTRDQAELLERCLDSVLKRTAYDNLRVVIADNDSREETTHALLRRVQQDKRVSIHPAPGKFNFAAICNAAAAKGEGRVIVFLNNDVEASHEDWLSSMVELALRPSIGAVGAKLVYPSGAMQHAGMVLGLHGAAGHLYRGAPPSESGYRQRLTRPHLVSAVTGACLAVERSKFERAGGFDAATFPVEYNDIDLCLRLNEMGHATAWTPDAVLVHAESATRGRPFLPGFRRKGNERADFLKRWAEAVVNDPFFHPAFSLASENLSLA